MTFDPATDRILNFVSGDNAFADAKGVLEHLAITADPNSLDVGPYTLWIDEITSGGVTFGNFEAYNDGDEVIFRQPSFSGSTSGNIQVPPNTSRVDGDVGYPGPGGKSDKIDFRFIDEDPSRWIRLTSFNATF